MGVLVLVLLWFVGVLHMEACGEKHLPLFLSDAHADQTSVAERCCDLIPPFSPLLCNGPLLDKREALSGLPRAQAS